MRLEHVPFPAVQNRLRRFANPITNKAHQGLFAGTRSGKSFLIRHGILSGTDFSRIVVIDVKSGGAQVWDGWGNDVSELEPGFSIGADGTAHYRMLMKRGDTGKTQMTEFLEIIKAEGHCVVVIDDSRQITSKAPGLGLSDHIDELLTIGGENGITAILAANSTVWATSGIRDQCGAYWIGQITNTDEIKKIASFAGLHIKTVMPVISKLKPRQFLYSDRYDGDVTMCITGLPEGLA